MCRCSQSPQVTAFQLPVNASARRARPQMVARTMHRAVGHLSYPEQNVQASTAVGEVWEIGGGLVGCPGADGGAAEESRRLGQRAPREHRGADGRKGGGAAPVTPAGPLRPVARFVVAHAMSPARQQAGRVFKSGARYASYHRPSAWLEIQAVIA